MSNLVIDPVLSGYNMAKVNENFQRISEIINNSLIHKDGANALTGDLDVNGKTLLNVGDVVVGGKSIFSGVNEIREEYENLVLGVQDLVASLKAAMDEAISQGSVDALHRNNAQVTWRLTAPYLNGETYTIPVYYTVGKNTIRLSYNGIVILYRGVDYEEVGDIGERSNQIKMLRNIPIAAIVEAWVDGEEDMTQILETVNASAELLSAYPPELLTNFISAVNEYNDNHLDESVAEAKVVSDTLANRTIVANEDLIQFNTYKNSIEQFYNQISTWYQQMSNLYTNLIIIGESELDLANFEEALEGLATTLSGIEAQSQIVAQNMQSISDKYSTVVSKEASISEKYDEIVEYTANALEYSSNAYVWAEGEDSEVEELEGEHSSKGWALIAQEAAENANETASNVDSALNEALTSAESFSDEASTSAELAGTYAQNAHDDYTAIQSVADSLGDAVEEANQIIEQAQLVRDSITLDQLKSKLYAEGSDEELAMYEIEDITHSSKVWAQLVEEASEAIAGFDVHNYYTKSQTEALIDDVDITEDYAAFKSATSAMFQAKANRTELESYVEKVGDTLSGALHFDVAGHDIISVDKVPSGDYRDIVFKNSDGTKRIAVTRISNLANGGKEISFAPINNANSYGKAFVIGMDSSDNFYVKANNSTVITEDNIEDYLPPPVDTIPSGLIAMWSGAANAIPFGWYLCNGENNTPDLRDRFIVGAGNSYSVGAKGGSNSASASVSGTTGAASGNTGAASGNVGATSITVAQLASHNHSLPYPQNYSDGKYSGLVPTTGLGNTGNTTGNTGSGNTHTHSLNSHTHTLNSHTHSMSNGSVTLDTRSPYYALCFIMKG